MLVAPVAIPPLFVYVIVIYLLLKSMGQDGVEVAAPGSCKRGRCGVPNGTATETRRQQGEDPFGDADEIKRPSALE